MSEIDSSIESHQMKSDISLNKTDTETQGSKGEVSKSREAMGKKKININLDRIDVSLSHILPGLNQSEVKNEKD